MLKKTVCWLALLCLFSGTFSFSQVPDVGGRVVFVSNRDGNENLWILDLETMTTYPITDFSGPEGIIRVNDPRWSPDGKMIAFIGDIGGASGRELFVINDDGTGIKKLTDYALINNYAKYPCWNPNSSDYVYYNKVWPAVRAIVHRVNIDTLVDVEIPNYRGSNSRLWDITSDGNEYLFGRELSCCWTPYQYTGYQDFNSTYERIIKPSDGYAERIGRINREDNWIVYAESHGSSGAYPPDNIYKMDADGNYVTQLTFGSGGEANRYPVWTQGDSSGYLVFESNHFGNFEIVMMKAKPGEYPNGLINLTLDPTSDRYPDWTPFGHFKKVNIDIKPGSFPNSINLGSNGNVPVAIFSTEGFDATTVDPTTVTLAGAAVRIKGKGTAQAFGEDVDEDGLLDLVVHVDTTALELTMGDTEAILEGKTFDGVSIRGVDTVRIVNE